MRPAVETLVIALDAPDDFAGFRQAARVLLAMGAEPDAIHWRYAAPLAAAEAPMLETDLFASNAADSAAGQALSPDALDQLPVPPSAPVHIKKPQLASLRAACCHRNPARFALCYRWLWRVQQAPHLAADVLDADWRDIERLAKAVGREIHKMHAFVRFRPAHQDGAEPLHIAWFEPDHYIVRAGAGFFMRRFPNMRWAILTPDCSALWDLHQLQFAPGASKADAPGPDAGEALWLAYYQSTFNPARLKEQAMLREMPRRYWKNLPEAQLISSMVASATHRTGHMLAVHARKENS
ncbi:MAG: TIGR03915 family putative DNA repair protein [Comamonas sp.]